MKFRIYWPAILSVVVAVSYAQEPATPYFFRGDFECPVLNIPFTADEVWSELRTAGWWEVRHRVTIARDSKGRIAERYGNGPRPEDTSDPPSVRVIVEDPTTRTTSKWTQGEKKVTQSFPVNESGILPIQCSSLPSTAHTTIDGEGPGAIVTVDSAFAAAHGYSLLTKSELLGREMVEGTPSIGIRITTESPEYLAGEDMHGLGIVERWYSPDLHTEVMRIDTTRTVEEHRITLENIKRGEPDPTLFALPDGYVLQKDSQ